MKLDIIIDLNWPTYEDDINEAVKDAVLREVRAEVAKQAKVLREQVAKAIKANEKNLIDKALSAINK